MKLPSLLRESDDPTPGHCVKPSILMAVILHRKGNRDKTALLVTPESMLELIQRTN